VQQIDDAMYLSIKTIERHKENIKAKHGIQHATQWVLGEG